MALNSKGPERPGAEPDETSDSLHLISAGRKLLAEEPDWPREDQAGLKAALGDLETAVRSLDGRLALGLLGGTGVGKSTLISALAGEVISPAGPVRPTTSQPVIYRHESYPPAWPGLEVVHRLDSLKNLAIIDFPDFDSLKTDHHQLVLDNLNGLDLVAWITDPQKYADRRLYEVMGRVRAGPLAQVVILNKADELAARPEDGQEALAKVLESFGRQLGEFGGWTGAPPWAVSAAEALARPGDPEAGGLGPLRQRLADLAEAKLRREVEMGNLAARNRDIRARLARAARPEDWLKGLKALKRLADDFQPRGVIAGDLAAIDMSAFVSPKLALLRQRATGLLSLFSDGWDFVAGPFKSGGPPWPNFEPGAPGLVKYLMGRGAELSSLTGRPLEWTQAELARDSGAALQKILDEKFRLKERTAQEPKVSSAPLILWPTALAALLIWAETGGQYGGPAALTAAALRSAAPWLIFGVLGDLFLSRFIWFRARRFYEADFHQALALAHEALIGLADGRLGQPLARAIDRQTRILNLLADLGPPPDADF